MPSNPFKAGDTSDRIAMNRHGLRIRNLERRIHAGDWIIVGTYPTDSGTTPDSPPFQNSFTNSGDGGVTADQLTRFRWRIGTGSGLELQLNVAGGNVGDIIFTLPANFWIGAKQTFPGTDDAGNPACYTVVPRDDDSGLADVYFGRV